MKNPWGLEECLLRDGFFLVQTFQPIWFSPGRKEGLGRGAWKRQKMMSGLMDLS